MKKSANSVTMKATNRSRILYAILANHLSRQDIADYIGLTPAAVSILVGDMINEGILLETGDTIEATTRGRKRSTINLNASYRYLIGIALEQDGITISLSTLTKDILDSVLYRYYKPDIEFIFQYIERTVHELLRKNNIVLEQVLGIGVTIVGLVNSSSGVSHQAYELWHEAIPVKDRLESIFLLPVVVDNNVRALALAEKEQRNNHDSIVFVKYGPGIGASLIFDETIYRGAFYNALELGHTIVTEDNIRCSCGKTGCLETIGSYKAIRHKLESVFKETSLYDEKDKHSIYNIDLDDIESAYANKDPIVVEIVDDTIHFFAVGLINLVLLFDSTSVVLYGPFFERDVFFEQLKTSIIRLGCDCYKRMERSILPSNKTIGALSLARKKLFLDRGAMTKEN
jgi:predicted NBD/HSP70 family sugar kinase